MTLGRSPVQVVSEPTTTLRNVMPGTINNPVLRRSSGFDANSWPGTSPRTRLAPMACSTTGAPEPTLGARNTCPGSGPIRPKPLLEHSTTGARHARITQVKRLDGSATAVTRTRLPIVVPVVLARHRPARHLGRLSAARGNRPAEQHTAAEPCHVRRRVPVAKLAPGVLKRV